MPSILFANGLLVDPGSGIFGERDLLVRDGRVEALAPSLAPFEHWKHGREPLTIYNLKGWYVFPGLVDIHTHLRVPGQEHKEDLETGTRAAAAGGFTTVLTMPNTNPCVDRVPVLRDLVKRIRSEAVVRVRPIAALTRGQRGKRLVAFEGLRRQGAVAFSDDGASVMDPSVMQEAMRKVVRLGCPVVSHCEDVRLSRGGAIHEGKVARELGVRGIPRTAEDVMTARDLILAMDTRARLHIAHVSTAGSVGMIQIAKDKGVGVTAEVTPHHLVLDEEHVLAAGTNAKVNPPLRTEEDRKALEAGLRDGTLDAVASDHAPHHPDEKATSLLEAPFGVIGLETTLAVVLSLVHKGRIRLERAVEVLTVGPARAMGLQAGILRAGHEADLVVVALESRFQVNERSFRSKAKNSPFAGWSLKGRPVLTMVAGKVVHQEEGLFRGRVTIRQESEIDQSRNRKRGRR